MLVVVRVLDIHSHHLQSLPQLGNEPATFQSQVQPSDQSRQVYASIPLASLKTCPVTYLDLYFLHNGCSSLSSSSLSFWLQLYLLLHLAKRKLIAMAKPSFPKICSPILVICRVFGSLSLQLGLAWLWPVELFFSASSFNRDIWIKLNWKMLNNCINNCVMSNNWISVLSMAVKPLYTSKIMLWNYPWRLWMMCIRNIRKNASWKMCWYC